VLQEDVLVQRDAVVGNQRNFAQTVNDYIEKKIERRVRPPSRHYC
jgi:hypothetical protein